MTSEQLASILDAIDLIADETETDALDIIDALHDIGAIFAAERDRLYRMLPV